MEEEALAEVEVEEEALAEEVALAEEEAAAVALVEAVVVAVSAILVEVPVRFKAVNPAVVQVDLEGVAKVPLGVQVVGVLEVDYLAEEVLAVFAILAEVSVHSRVVNPAVVQVDLEGVAKASPVVQVVEVLEAGNLAVVVLAVSAILAEVSVHSKVVKPVVVQVGLEEVVKAEISEEEE